MSILSTKSIQCYTAPIDIGPEHISLTGSWQWAHPGTTQEWLMNPTRLCHLRLHCWKQQIGNDIVPACLDWSLRPSGKTFKHEVELKFLTSKQCDSILEGLSIKIHSILNESNLRKVHLSFQQEHPGA